MNKASPVTSAGGLRWYVRMPLKWLTFAVVLLFVSFPDPRLAWRSLQRYLNLNSLIDAEHPRIREWADKLSTSQPALATTQPAHRHAVVEAFIYRHVPYAWDWVTYGAAEYIPTVAEMFEQAKRHQDGLPREDCDGRAVMCASLLAALGYESRIVTDLRHVWVETPEGALMGPGRRPTLVATTQGTRTDFRGTLANIPVSLSFGVSVFPFWREFILWLTLVLLSLHVRMSWRAGLIGTVLTLQGWLFMRCGVITSANFSWMASNWPGVVGLLHLAIGLCVLWTATHVARSRRVALRMAGPAPGV